MVGVRLVVFYNQLSTHDTQIFYMKRNSNCFQQCYIGIPFVDERMCMIDKPNFIWHCNILNFVEKSNVPTLNE